MTRQKANDMWQDDEAETIDDSVKGKWKTPLPNKKGKTTVKRAKLTIHEVGSEDNVIEETDIPKRSSRLAPCPTTKGKKKGFEDSKSEEEEEHASEEIDNKIKKVLSKKKVEKGGDESEYANSSTHVSEYGNDGPIDLTQDMMPYEIASTKMAEGWMRQVGMGGISNICHISLKAVLSPSKKLGFSGGNGGEFWKSEGGKGTGALQWDPPPGDAEGDSFPLLNFFLLSAFFHSPAFSSCAPPHFPVFRQAVDVML
ncbi:hypothetical protein SUGI_0948540 [Cryptomeria japonica]|nr:hypothetical protein SUGI_0948540 [Cryptomeria japonica]